MSFVPCAAWLDTGACQKIIDGKIKIKSGGAVERITSSGVRFDDGTELPADVIIVATGYVQQLLPGFCRIPNPVFLATRFDDGGVAVRRLLGEDKAAGIPPGWGLNA